MDEQHAQGLTPMAGSQQIAELIAEFGLQHDEWEARNAQNEAQIEADRKRAEKEPLWRRAK